MVADPVESHIDGMGVLLLDGVIGDFQWNAVVILDWGCRLGVAECVQGSLANAAFFHVNKQGSSSGLHCGGQALPEHARVARMLPLSWSGLVCMVHTDKSNCWHGCRPSVLRGKRCHCEFVESWALEDVLG